MEILDQPFLGPFTLGENIAALLVMGVFCWWLLQRINAFVAKEGDEDPVLKSKIDQMMLNLDLEVHGLGDVGKNVTQRTTDADSDLRQAEEGGQVPKDARRSTAPSQDL